MSTSGVSVIGPAQASTRCVALRAHARGGERGGVLGRKNPDLQLAEIGREQLVQLLRVALSEDQGALPESGCLQRAVEGATPGTP